MMSYFTGADRSQHIHIHLPADYGRNSEGSHTSTTALSPISAASRRVIYEQNAQGQFVPLSGYTEPQTSPALPASTSANPPLSSQYVPTRRYLTDGLEHLHQRAPKTDSRSQQLRARVLDPIFGFFTARKDSQPNVNQTERNLEGKFDPKLWDGLPDGEIEINATHEEAKECKTFLMHWPFVTSGLPTKRGGSATADCWENGKYKRRQCLGTITCNNPDCFATVRPQTRAEDRECQLNSPCMCSHDLSYFPCPAFAILRTWEGGVHFEHHGVHNHLPPSYTLHLLDNALAQFERIVYANPKAGALNLLVGANGHPSVGSIAPPLRNIDRVRVEQKKARSRFREAINGQVLNLNEWVEQHPDYVRYHCNEDGVEMVCLQSAFMSTLALRDIVRKNCSPDELKLKVEERVSGHVTDAAHGFFANDNAILIVTSVFTKILLSWIPILMAYSNGQTSEHYRRYFRVLFNSIRENAASYNDVDGIGKFIYALFAGVGHLSYVIRSNRLHSDS
jgi:hypothetical protein